MEIRDRDIPLLIIGEGKAELSHILSKIIYTKICILSVVANWI
jgi:hypothetical protein